MHFLKIKEKLPSTIIHTDLVTPLYIEAPLENPLLFLCNKLQEKQKVSPFENIKYEMHSRTHTLKNILKNTFGEMQQTPV